MARVVGIEPTQRVLETLVLPLYYTRLRPEASGLRRLSAFGGGNARKNPVANGNI